MAKRFNRDIDLTGTSRLVKNGTVLIEGDGSLSSQISYNNVTMTGTTIYATLNDGTTSLAATALEVNRNCDASTRLLAAGATLSATVALHDGKVVHFDTASGSVVTLPVAAGTGAVIRFVVSTKATSNAHIVKVADASGTIVGSVNLLDNDSNAQTAYAASGTDDTLTWNGTTTGGQVGDWVEFIDLKANVWACRGDAVCPTGSNVADCFSATVA